MERGVFGMDCMPTIEGCANVLCSTIIQRNDSVYQFFSKYVSSDFDCMNEFSVELYSMMSSWFQDKNIKPELSLINIIYYCLNKELGDGHGNIKVSDVYEHFLVLRKGRKKYFLKGLKEELEQKKMTRSNPRFLENEWSAVSNPFLKKFKVEKTCSSKGDYFAKRYGEVSNWAADKTEPLCTYVFFEQLSVKRQVACFLIDMSCTIYKDICTFFFGDVFGYITWSPDEFFINPFFGVQSKIPTDVEFEFEDDVVKIYDCFLNSDGTKIRHQVAEERDEIFKNEDSNIRAECVKRLKQRYLKSSIDAAFKADTSPDKSSPRYLRSADPLDSQILTCVMNRVTIDTYFGASPLIIKLQDMCNDVFGISNCSSRGHKHQRLDTLAEHLYRLAHLKVDSSIVNSDGEVVAVGTSSLFDVIIYSGRGDVTDSTNRSVLSDSSYGLPPTLFGSWDVSKAYCAISLSDEIKCAWRDGIHSSMYSGLYHALESPRSKMFAQILQNERIRAIYPSLNSGGDISWVKISYSFFRSKLRIESTMARFRQILDTELSYFKDRGVFVADYKIESNGVDILFCGYSEIEAAVYKMGIANNTTCCIVANNDKDV